MEAYELGAFKVTVTIKELVIKRFRGFEGQLTVPFDEDLTVFIGVNGAGKSTILDAVRGLLDDVACLLKGGSYDPGKFFGYFDVNNDQGEQGDAEIQLGLEMSFPYKEEVQDRDGNYVEDWKIEDNYSYRIGLRLTRQKHLAAEFSTYYQEEGIQNRVRDSLKEHLLEWIQKSSNPSFDLVTSMELPVLAYFPIRRLDEEASSDARLIDTGIFSNYSNQELAADSFHFPTLKTWLGLQYLIKTQPQKKQNGDARNRKIYDAIIQAVKQFLNEDDNLTFPDISFEWSEDFPKGEMVIQKGETSLYYRQLSSGEQVILALVADFARQLAIANPRREDPLKGSGVVLIDEIDLHLHPGWQRKVVAKLREVFPNVQLVITTHSPIILGGLPSKNILVLNQGQLSSADETYGREVDDILEIVMEVAAGKFSIQIDKISQLIAEGTSQSLKEAERKLNELIQEIDRHGDRGAEHPDVLRMRGLLKRKRILNR
ncbi:MAG: AAA family ATPase [Phaeodactylibacter sp.]|nr:AAA family ATPase [Phaeodactylibacter sp.]